MEYYKGQTIIYKHSQQRGHIVDYDKINNILHIILEGEEYSVEPDKIEIY